MMELTPTMFEFAESRDKMVDSAEERLAPLVEKWLEDPSRMRLNLIVAEAAEIWSENFEDIAPSGVPDVAKEAFIRVDARIARQDLRPGHPRRA